MKKWEEQSKLKVQSEKFKVADLIALLLENRGLKTTKEREEFLHPQLETITPKSVGIDVKQLKKALGRITKAIEEKEQIVVFGDYDVDGITGSAILWETLHGLGANVLPYIPHRIEEGYGLSLAGIKNVMEKIPRLASLARDDKGGLIITVDNGIVANEAVAFANQQGIDVIITDHHTVGEKLPDAYAIVHTTKLCGAGVAYVLSKEITPPNLPLSGEEQRSSPPEKGESEGVLDTHLELAALGTVADMVPLTGANRAIVKYGLEKLGKTKRLGLLALFQQAGLTKDVFGVYDIGFVIAPRLNAAGRIESAMDSLRLLCTKSPARAEMLAEQLELTNRERQLIMKAAAADAIGRIKNQESIRQAQDRSRIKNLLFVAHESYQQGVIGLVAGKLVEEFYRPSIVMSIGEQYSKASVRSINGFNIIEFLRGSFDDFVNIGGHPMAAGFTIATERIGELQQRLESLADEHLTDDVLIRTLKVDCELPLEFISLDLYQAIQTLAPFGMGNSEPVFVSRKVMVKDMRTLGAGGKHLKLELRSKKQELRGIEAIGFGFGEYASKLKIGDTIDIAYTIDENTWNGNTKLQLKIKDIKLN